MKVTVLLILLCLPSLIFCQWNQAGSYIDGESADDNYGTSVGLNDAGTIVAIGGTDNDANGMNSGHVQVLEWTGNSWIQMGADLEGDAAGDRLCSVDINASGTTVVVGTKSFSFQSTTAGYARVFDWDGTAWVQRGVDINGLAIDDAFGSSVSLSASGSVVAIGAPGRPGINGTYSGQTTVFEWDGIAWVQKGGSMDGEAATDFSGRSVSLSDDGSTVSIGATGNDDNGSGSGHVRVYTWDGAQWMQKGVDLDGMTNSDAFGYDVSLSSDGNVIAIGVPGHNEVQPDAGQALMYEWDGSSWVQRGQGLGPTGALNNAGTSVSISNNGNIVAVGAHEYTDTPGTVRIYEWNGSAWAQIEESIIGDVNVLGGQFGAAVGLNGDGSMVAVGAHAGIFNPATNPFTGYAAVYQNGFPTGPDCSIFETAPVDLTKSFDPIGGVEDRVQLKFFKDSPQVAYASVDSAACDLLFWKNRLLDPETGQVFGDPIANPDSILLSQVQKANNNPLFKWPVKYRADGANNSKRVEPNLRYQWKARCYCQKGAGPVSPWSATKIFNTPNFDPSTGENGSGNIVEDNSDLKSVTNTFKVNLYPNPTEGILNLSYKTRKEDASTIMVLDMFGKVVYNEVILGSGGMMNVQLDMSNLSIGNYILRIHNELQTTTERFNVTR